MVGAEKQPGTLHHPAGQGLEKQRLQQPVLVVPLLRPRIGKQDPDLLEPNNGRQCVQEFARFAAQKTAVFQVVAGAFFFRALDSLHAAIDADKVFVPAEAGIVSEEMAVPAADFPDQGPRNRTKKGVCQRGQARTPGGDVREEILRENYFWDRQMKVLLNRT